MPRAEQDLQAKAVRLEEELGLGEQEFVEAEAKNELYKLLEIRTRWGQRQRRRASAALRPPPHPILSPRPAATPRRDHRIAEQQMREARALSKDADDDHTALTKHMHETRVAREEAERELASTVAMFDQVREDWRRKLKDRRKEVRCVRVGGGRGHVGQAGGHGGGGQAGCLASGAPVKVVGSAGQLPSSVATTQVRELEKRKADEATRREQQATVQTEQERVERESAARQLQDRANHQARLSVVMPELEALEAVWARLHTICGASTPEDVVAYWQGASGGAPRALLPPPWRTHPPSFVPAVQCCAPRRPACASWCAWPRCARPRQSMRWLACWTSARACTPPAATRRARLARSSRTSRLLLVQLRRRARVTARVWQRVTARRLVATVAGAKAALQRLNSCIPHAARRSHSSQRARRTLQKRRRR